MTDPAIQHISDTARWAAVYRARETERKKLCSAIPSHDGWQASAANRSPRPPHSTKSTRGHG